MTAAESLAGWLRLTLTPGIGSATQRKLLSAFGLPDAIFAAGRSALTDVVGNKAATRLLETDRQAAIDAALSWAEKPTQHLLCLADSAYPRALLQIADPPNLIYVRGRLELLNSTALAVVGSRNPTPQGMDNATRFSVHLGNAGLTISSGLALGIDAAAHRGALRTTASTVAVIGTGIDRLYPAANGQLAYEIATKGAIVSELPLGTPPIAANFPRRNRLIAGLSRGTLVVEATVESGSLITARLSAEQGREVFAIPGSIHSPQSRGCHRLIKDGAKLVETVQDVLDELRWSAAFTVPLPAAGSRDNAQGLLDQMGFDPCGLDELSSRCGLTANFVSVMLLHLELAGQVATLPGGRYQRIAPA